MIKSGDETIEDTEIHVNRTVDIFADASMRNEKVGIGVSIRPCSTPVADNQAVRINGRNDNGTESD